MMGERIQRLERSSLKLSAMLAIVLLFSGRAGAQFPAYSGGGVVYGYPGWGYGGFYGIPPMAYGYGAVGYGYPGWGYGYPGAAFGSPFMGAGYSGGYGYPIYYGFGYGNPGFYTPGLFNPWFGAGLTPLGAQSYMIETQLFGRRSAR
jgi:hypothetical protein